MSDDFTTQLNQIKQEMRGDRQQNQALTELVNQLPDLLNCLMPLATLPKQIQAIEHRLQKLEARMSSENQAKQLSRAIEMPLAKFYMEAISAQFQSDHLILALEPLPQRLNQFDQQIQALTQEMQSLKSQTQELSAIVTPLPNDLATVLETFLVQLQQALIIDAP